MKLYELSGNFSELFDRFDEISNFTPDTDENGNYIDSDGNKIDDLESYRESYLYAWFETLSALEEEFDVKAENIAVFIKGINAEINEMKAEEKNLKKRRQQLEKNSERLTRYLYQNMSRIGKRKIETPRVRLTLRLNAESLVVDSPSEFVEWAMKNKDELLRYPEPEIRKADAKKALQSGAQLPFVHLTRTESLIIK